MPATPPLRREAREVLALAFPLAFGQAALSFMSFVDTAFVGRLGASALAGVGIGNGIFFGVTVIGIGLLLGMDPLVSQAIGANEPAKARSALREGFRIAFFASLALAAVIAALALALDLLGVPAETTREARRFMFARLPSLVPFLIFFPARSYLQARTLTRPLVTSVIVGNVVNLVANALLVDPNGLLEHFGSLRVPLPSLGVVGSGFATTLATTASTAMILVGLRAARDRDRESDASVQAMVGARADAAANDARAMRRTVLRLGAPIALQLLAEVGMFTVVGVLAGRLDAASAAGHQVALMLASMSFCVALGISSASSVFVGRAVGRGDTPAARRSGFLCFGMTTLFMACSAALFFGLPGPLARLLTDQPDVLARALPLLRITAVFQLSDGLQACAAAALRGAGDTRTSQIANVVGHYGVGLPIALALGFGLGWGISGLWWGLSAGLTTVAVVLVARFHVVSSRPIARVA